MNKFINKNKSNNKNKSSTNDKSKNKFNQMSIDTIQHIYGFLQRTDKIAWKLTSKLYYSKLIYNSADLNEELNLYTKTIDKLDYTWKDDTKYITIKEFPPKLAEKYSILKNYAVLTDLWDFNFNAEFDVYPGDYRILCLTNVTGYTMNIKFTAQADGKITETIHQPIANKIKIKFETKGKIRVNCSETSKVKNLKTIQYIMCIPEYYWGKIKSYKNRHPEWKRQIVMTNEGLDGRKILRYYN